MIPTSNISVVCAVCILLLMMIPSTPWTANSVGSLIYCGCSQLRYGANLQYGSNINSLLTSLVNSASHSYYNKLAIGSGTPSVVYGIFQCRPDIQQPECASCVATSVGQIGSHCADSCGGAVQLEGCYVRYDNRTFLGVEDKTVVESNCGPPVGYNSAELTIVDSVLAYLGSGGGLYRVGGSGNVQGVAECLGDLTGGQCQDCLAAAIGQLKSSCAGAAWGDVFLGTCYARYFVGGSGSYSPPNSGMPPHLPMKRKRKNMKRKENLVRYIYKLGFIIVFSLAKFMLMRYR
ncbi:hypothetical protein Dimus_014591 [Dionaea muscipula]